MLTRMPAVMMMPLGKRPEIVDAGKSLDVKPSCGEQSESLFNIGLLSSLFVTPGMMRACFRDRRGPLHLCSRYVCKQPQIREQLSAAWHSKEAEHVRKHAEC